MSRHQARLAAKKLSERQKDYDALSPMQQSGRKRPGSTNVKRGGGSRSRRKAKR